MSAVAHPEMAFVASAEYARVCGQRDGEIAAHDETKGKLAEAEVHVDALMGKCARLEDSKANAVARERLELLQAVGRVLDRMAPGADERGAFNALFAHLAEWGRR